MRGRTFVWVVGLFVAAPLPAQVGPQGSSVVEVGLALRQLDGVKRVLMIGAHPDDEDSSLLATLARGMGVETAYLSLTRGDGGQNIIGPELGEGLGIIRTGELEAARALDGARQFFTRAFDYGFSKSADEAFAPLAEGRGSPGCGVGDPHVPSTGDHIGLVRYPSRRTWAAPGQRDPGQ